MKKFAVPLFLLGLSQLSFALHLNTKVLDGATDSPTVTTDPATPTTTAGPADTPSAVKANGKPPKRGTLDDIEKRGNIGGLKNIPLGGPWDDNTTKEDRALKGSKQGKPLIGYGQGEPQNGRFGGAKLGPGQVRPLDGGRKQDGTVSENGT